MSRIVLHVWMVLSFLVLTVGESVSAIPDSSDVERALSAREKGDLEQAIKLLRSTWSQDTGNIEVGYELGVTLGWSGRLEEALALFDTILDSHPDHLGTALIRARTLTWLGRPRQALSAYSAIQPIGAPDSLEILMGSATAKSAMANYSGARRNYRRVLSTNGGNAEALEAVAGLWHASETQLLIGSTQATLVEGNQQRRNSATLSHRINQNLSFGISAGQEVWSYRDPLVADAQKSFVQINGSSKIGTKGSIEATLGAFSVGGSSEFNANVGMWRQLSERASVHGTIGGRLQDGRLGDRLISLGLLYGFGPKGHLFLRTFQYQSNISDYRATSVVLQSEIRMTNRAFLRPVGVVVRDDFATRATLSLGGVYFVARQLALQGQLGRVFGENGSNFLGFGVLLRR